MSDDDRCEQCGEGFDSDGWWPGVDGGRLCITCWEAESADAWWA